MADILKSEDYTEPRCLLDIHPDIVHIPIGRIIDKLDLYLSKNNHTEAERHLQYWLTEADTGHDMRGKLTILNEQIGLYRKLGKGPECLTAISQALTLADTLDIKNTITYGTTLINAATGYKAFGKTTDALPLYRMAQDIYESNLDPVDGRLGGLYNNMALTLAELKNYREAEENYQKAIEIMSKKENGELETAITYLNLADLIFNEKGPESGEKQICEYVEKAEKLLNAKT